MIDRRRFLEIAAGAGASLTLAPELLRALRHSNGDNNAPGKMIQRRIHSSGEMLPVIGLTFGNHVACADPAALTAVIRTFVEHGGRSFDAMSHSDARAEAVTIPLLNEAGFAKNGFISWRSAPPGPPQPGATIGRDYIDSVLTRLNVSKLNLVMVGSNSPEALAMVKEAKKEGKVQYIGVQTGLSGGNPALEAIMRAEPIDFIGVHYGVDFRNAEVTVLPLALERKIAVMTLYPFGGADTPCPGTSAPPPSMSRSFFTRVANTPLPEWAAEFDAKTWAQFALKYIVSHPAVTVVRMGTTKTQHLIDNIAGGTGKLPDEAMRKRMAALIDAIPKPPQPVVPPTVTVAAAILQRYVGEWKTPSGTVITFRFDGTRLFAKGGNNPDTPLAPRSETRLQIPPLGPVFEFQVDAAGTVTGVILEQGNPVQRVVLTRVQ